MYFLHNLLKLSDIVHLNDGLDEHVLREQRLLSRFFLLVVNFARARESVWHAVRLSRDMSNDEVVVLKLGGPANLLPCQLLRVTVINQVSVIRPDLKWFGRRYQCASPFLESAHDSQ